MSLARLTLSLAVALGSIAVAHAATPVQVGPQDFHMEALRPATQTYFVYFHGEPDTGFKRSMLATTQVAKEKVDGSEAWVITQHWEDETGVVHSARTVHSARDLATIAQTSTWKRPTMQYTTTVDPKHGKGTLEGNVPDEMRRKAEAGFATMQDGWWMNWHSDLTLLPLLPYEKGGTLRVHLFDVGMDAPMDVDYIVVGDRKLQGGDGKAYDCWLVETESGRPGSGNFQRFWIEKTQRVVIKEEDTFNGQYRSKVLLAVPAVVEFPVAPVAAPPKGQ